MHLVLLSVLLSLIHAEFEVHAGPYGEDHGVQQRPLMRRSWKPSLVC